MDSLLSFQHKIREYQQYCTTVQVTKYGIIQIVGSIPYSRKFSRELYFAVFDTPRKLNLEYI